MSGPGGGKLLAGVTASAIGLTLSVLVAWHLHEQENRGIREGFELELVERIDALQRELDMHVEALGGLKALYETVEPVRREQFRSFAGQTIARQPAIQALEWIPRVGRAARPRIEAEARRDGHDEFHITEQRQGGLVPAAERPEYFPVFYVEPLEGNRAALGFDLASDRVRKEALDAARDSGEMQVTEAISLVQEPSGFGFLVFAPVFRGDPSTVPGRRDSLRGFLLGVYRVDTIVAKALGPAGPGFALRLADRSQTLYVSESTGETADSEAHSEYGLEGAIGSRWTITAWPTEAYFASRRTLQPFAALAIGLGFTVVVVGYMCALAGRSGAVHGLVAERTSELTEANERLERQRAILQSILDNLGDGVVVADRNGKLILFNPAAEDILGVGLIESGPDEWTRLYGLYLPDGETPVPEDQLPLARALAGEPCRNVDLFVRNPSRPGGVFIRVTATPLKDRRGGAHGAVAVFRDITQRTWAEAVLRDSEARFRAIVEATASALIILSPEYKVQEFNPRAEAVFGVGRVDALGKDFFALCRPTEGRDLAEAALRKVLAGEGTAALEMPIRSQDGTERTLLWSFSRSSEAEDRSTTIIASGNDITERRQAEEARRVRELAAHLQSARENERAHLAREIHDELGQALTGLKFAISSLKRRTGTESAENRDRLAQIEQMIDGTISSVRHLAAALRPQVLDELGLLEAIRWQVREFRKQTGIFCSLELPDEEIDWDADRATAMFRVVQESLTNVARHARAKHVTVRVRRHESHILVEVVDDGRGITEEQLANSRSFGLLGMRERARMFGGTLRILRGDETGTIVTVRMPA